MYWCFNCEREFEELDIYTDFIGVEPYGCLVRFYKCPICGSEETDYALICPICGEYCGELFGYGKKGLCNNCVEKAATFENIINWCDDDKQRIDINCVLSELLSVSEIEEILIDYLLNAPKSSLTDIRLTLQKNKFVDTNRDCFADYIISEKIYND